MLTKNDLFQIKKIVGEEISPVKKDVIKIRKDISIIVSAFDNEYLDLRKRLERIENHLNLSPIN